MKHTANQFFLSFEQSIRDREQAEHDAQIAAKAAEKAAHEEAKRKEEMEKSTRRLMRAFEYKRRNTVDWAVCGIRCYNRNAYTKQGWTNCHHCGAALRYFENLNDAQADAKTRECKR
jgi:hypothetical protein